MCGRNASRRSRTVEDVRGGVDSRVAVQGEVNDGIGLVELVLVLVLAL